MRKLLTAAGAAAVVSVLAVPAGASTGYTVAVDAPATGADGYAVVRDTVHVRASVPGDHEQARYAAYHVRPAGGAWSQQESVALQPAGEGVFASEETPWSTAGLPNGVYELEVRVWGDVPPYRPAHRATFASQVVEARVDKGPPVPRRVWTGTAVRAVRVVWSPVPASDRDDFLGYRVLARRDGCSSRVADHGVLGETSGRSLTRNIDPGRYCFRVVAVRSSAVSGTIASRMSPGVITRVPHRAGGISSGTIGGAAIGRRDGKPPSLPRLGRGSLFISDGAFLEDLPYGPRTVTEMGEAAADEREPGPDPRARPLAIAGGLVLVLAAVLLRWFLRRGLA